MTNKIFTESLSSVIDGEAGELELRRTLCAIADDDKMKRQWARKQALRSAFKGEMVDEKSFSGDLSFAAGVSAALEDEVVHKKTWGLGLARFAVAASVMGVVLSTTYLMNINRSTPAPVVVAQQVMPLQAGAALQASVNASAVSPSVTSPFTVGEVARASADADQLAAQRLRWYMNTHAEKSALNSGYGMLQFARMIDQGE